VILDLRFLIYQQVWRDYLMEDKARADEALFKNASCPTGSKAFEARVLMDHGRPVYGHRGKKADDA
jgi:hypothetical protein